MDEQENLYDDMAHELVKNLSPIQIKGLSEALDRIKEESEVIYLEVDWDNELKKVLDNGR